MEFVNGQVAGVFMGMMQAMHPRMGEGNPLQKTGLFGKNLHPMAPVGLVVLHIVFGLVLGWAYTGL